MSLIKPHLDEFDVKYQMIFDGNDYAVDYMRRDYDEFWITKQRFYGWKWSCYLRMFLWRAAQHRERNREVKRASRQLNEPKVIVP